MATMSVALTRRTARAAFWAQWDSQPNMTDGLAFNVDSDSVEEVYPWILYAPAVREKLGAASRDQAPTIDWTIKNKRWENSVEIAYELRRFEKIGQIEQTISMLAQKARDYPSKLISELMNDGHSTACYDTQFFFDTDHTDPGASYTTSQDNDKTSAIVSATAPTDIEFATAVRGAIDALLGYKDGAGDPVMPPPMTVFTVMVPPGYSSIAQRVARVDQLTGPVGNDLQGRIRVVENPWLDAPATTAAFFVINENSIRKPFIYQTADPIQLMDDAGGDYEMTTKDILFFTHGYYNTGYGDWRQTVRHLFTTI